MDRLFRIQPLLPVGGYKTYDMRAPAQTHWRPATCEEVQCGAWRHGWKTIVPIDSAQAQYIRAAGHGRRFFESPAGAGLTEFLFPAGQRCFQSTKHQVPLERPPLFTVRGGDWRGSTGVIRRHVRAEDFVEDWALHQQKLRERYDHG